MNREPAPSLPANASFLSRIRVGVRCLDVLKDDPANPHYGPLQELWSQPVTEIAARLCPTA